MINLGSVRSGAPTSVKLRASATPATGVIGDTERLRAFVGRGSELHLGADAGRLDLNEQASALQLARLFAAECREHLGEIRLVAGNVLSGHTELLEQGQVALAALVTLWQQRFVRTMGSLDPDLRLVAAGSARQIFFIRGMESLVQLAGPEEVLSLRLGRGISAPLQLGGAAEDGVLLQKLVLALAPLGIHARLVHGRLQFSIGELRWKEAQEGLTVRGEGKRFPTGQHVSLRVEAARGAGQPGHWRFADLAEVRATLQAGLLLDPLLEKVLALADRQLAILEAGLVPGSGTRKRVAGFASAFAQQLAEGGEYAGLAGLMPAFTHVDPQRTRTLLG